MIASILYATPLVALVSGLIWWAHAQGIEKGDDRATLRATRRIDEHVDGFLDWYHEAHDLERIKWRQNEVNAYTRGLSNARRLLREPRIRG
jgi:hypothetical protein